MDSCILNEGITNSQPSFAAKSYEPPLPTKMESKEKERELLRELDQMRKIKYEAEKKQPMLILSLDTKLEKKLKFIESESDSPPTSPIKEQEKNKNSYSIKKDR